MALLRKDIGNTEPLINTSGIDSIYASSTWILDSGATDHPNLAFCTTERGFHPSLRHPSNSASPFLSLANNFQQWRFPRFLTPINPLPPLPSLFSSPPHQSMEMRKIACAALIVAAATTTALAAEAPAPGPASASFAVSPAIGAAIGASFLSFFAFYLQ
ncbi:hypothetical protein ZIOFF_067170 [Zingiber officinale]|uniref:Uncharacterized protein n=2 Tax=Zingiber officinale TaxID=94328 RepID=A0A8J5C652_ZINOF|nr:hypothetical protein ZIOFF_067170 [Zingiber officinale]